MDQNGIDHQLLSICHFLLRLNDLHILDVGRLTEDELTETAVRSLITNLRQLVADPEFADVIL